MKGDVSRQTFRKGKRYSAVLAQQGRVQLDADVNEQQAIQRHHTETTAADLIGPRGAPKVGGGFEVGLTPDARSLTLSPGRLYVDGMLCEQAPTEAPVVVQTGDGLDVQLPSLLLDGWPIANGQLLEIVADDRPALAVSVSSVVDEAERIVRLNASAASYRTAAAPRVRRRVTVSTQPDYFEPLPDPLPNGRHLVYLEVWQRHLTALEDPEIRESALGGPDTTTRLKTVWQAKLVKVSNTATCSQLGIAWPPEPTVKGRLSPSTRPLGPDEGPCVLPPAAGYHRLENQLYRVEVHRGGTRSEATFKWSRENGSVVAPLESLSGQVATVASDGHDGLSSFDDDHWVEVLDDRLELNGRRGHLARIRSIDHARREIELEPTSTPLPSFGEADRPWHPKLRRWDHSETVGTEDGILMTARVELEGGISVEFSEGTYVPGDYWLIPARTARGDVEWPRDEANGYLAEPPHGLARHYCPLALVDVTNGAFALLPGDGSDCRPLFPPLTAIAASDVSFDNTVCSLNGAQTVQQALDLLCQRSSGLCTATATPGPGWEQVFDRIAESEDAQVCFPVGEYPVSGTVVVRNKGHLTLTGCGVGSRIESAASERVLVFEGCQSVTVRDLAVSSTSIVEKGTFDRVDGVLTFIDCETVAVERVALSGEGGTRRLAAALAVQGVQVKQGVTVRVRECTIGIGHEQVGILLVNVDRAHIEDNVLRSNPRPTALSLPRLLADPAYRARARALLISNMRFGNQAGVGPATNDSITIGETRVVFSTDPTLVNEWGRVFRDEKPANVGTPVTLMRYLRDLANRILLNAGAGIPAFVAWFDALRSEVGAVAAQGIVVGGTVAREVRILNNSLSGVREAVHVGVSHPARRPTPSDEIDRAGRVNVVGNSASLTLTALSGRERAGVFVGNCDSLLIEHNQLTVERPAKMQTPPVEGVRVYGFLGGFMFVRENHLVGFTTGVKVGRLGTVSGQPLRVVKDNLMPGASVRVDAPSDILTLTTGATVVDTNRS